MALVSMNDAMTDVYSQLERDEIAANDIFKKTIGFVMTDMLIVSMEDILSGRVLTAVVERLWRQFPGMDITVNGYEGVLGCLVQDDMCSVKSLTLRLWGTVSYD